MKTPKEKLAELMDKLFRGFTENKLYICDLATGLGKSHTLVNTTLNYYLNVFDRIVICTVRNTLVSEMKDSFVEAWIPKKKERLDDIMIVLQKNIQVLINVLDSQSHINFIKELKSGLSILKDVYQNKLNPIILKIEDCFNEAIITYDIYKRNKDKNDIYSEPLEKREEKLRRSVKLFFLTFKESFMEQENLKELSADKILGFFPSLETIYPQVAIHKKKIILATVHKLFRGADSILSNNINLRSLCADGKKTLVFFDESDMATTAVREIIYDNSVSNINRFSEFNAGFSGFLQYRMLLNNLDELNLEAYGQSALKELEKVRSQTDNSWNEMFKDFPIKRSIYLDKNESFEKYRRGIFFSGALNLSIQNAEDKATSYICCNDGDNNLSLLHSKDFDKLKKQWGHHVSLDVFLRKSQGNMDMIKSAFARIIENMAYDNREKTQKALDNLSETHFLDLINMSDGSLFSEIYAFFRLWGMQNINFYIQGLSLFMNNRRNFWIKRKDNIYKIPNLSVYEQGFQLYTEAPDPKDYRHAINLTCREVNDSFEKLLTDLVSLENVTVVNCSATATSRSVVNNCDNSYLRNILGDKYATVDKAMQDKLNQYNFEAYPVDHQIKVNAVKDWNFNSCSIENFKLPDKYLKMFNEDAVKEGLVNRWFTITKMKLLEEFNRKSKNKKEDSYKSVRKRFHLEMKRLFTFIDIYHWFINNDGVQSFLYFTNRKPTSQSRDFNFLACLIDGSFKSYNYDVSSMIEIPEWKNQNLELLDNWDKQGANITARLSSTKKNKTLLVTAYNTLKAGVNLQYRIPDDMKCLHGDGWDENSAIRKKDWDACYVEYPRGYLNMPDDLGWEATEMAFLNITFCFMMFYYSGYFNEIELKEWIYLLLQSGSKFIFYDKGNKSIILDKSFWVWCIIEQSIGRLCRTRNKSEVSYIFYDEELEKIYLDDAFKKSTTKEFSLLGAHLDKIKIDKELNTGSDRNEKITCNLAKFINRELNLIRRKALKYTVHPDFATLGEEQKKNWANIEVPQDILSAQFQDREFKEYIIRHPSVSILTDARLEGFPSLHKCYAARKRNEDGSIPFWIRSDGSSEYETTSDDPKAIQRFVSPKSVRLDIMSKNPVILEHFKNEGIPTEWLGDYILHPQLLVYEYAGELGEEAVRGILCWLGCPEERIIHPTGPLYELADFILMDGEGNFVAGISVKNYNPFNMYMDKRTDIASKDKLDEAKKRIGCDIFVVNIVQLQDDKQIYDVHEIPGIIDLDGNFIPESLTRLQNLINLIK